MCTCPLSPGKLVLLSNLLVLFLGCLAVRTEAQAPPICIFQLNCVDLGLDGWNGAYLEVHTAGLTTRYTMLRGSRETFHFKVLRGDSISMRFFPGLYDEEIQYELRNERDSILFAQRGQLPVAGLVYRNVAACAGCPAPPVFFVKPRFIGSGQARLAWQPADNTASTLILWRDPATFRTDTFRVRALDTLLSALKEKTQYTYYLASVCARDTSRPVGPFTLETRWKLDVGVNRVVAPATDCGLGTDSVKVAIFNYGGEPQSLIPYGYQINRVDIPVNRPVDGFYTGVVAMDSANVTAFDQPYPFATPGEYDIVAWTQVEKDGDIRNDSSRIRITSIPTIRNYPYLATLEERFTGWTVDAGGRAPSWELGTPNGGLLREAFGGIRAWGTKLSGNYNAGEYSFLNSPCFDFSRVTQEPVLSFRMQLDIERCCDGLWVEYSLDGGLTWVRLGSPGTGANWYNDKERWLWNGQGHTAGWFLAAHPLTGAAGKAQVKVRFVFNSDFGTQREGVLLDNLSVTVSGIDLSALSVANVRRSVCDNRSDSVVIQVGNLGRVPVTGLSLAYQVNGGPVITESASGLVLGSLQQGTYTFRQGFDSTRPGTYRIKAWLVGEAGQAQNDTALFTFRTHIALPFREDFEQGRFPVDWSGEDLMVTRGHNNRTYVVSDLLLAADPKFEVITAPLGPVAARDTFRFDYRAVTLASDGTEGAVWGTADRLEVAVSIDCGTSFQVVRVLDRGSHTPTHRFRTLAVDLSAYAGKYVQVRVSAIWGTGTYWMDFDDFRLIRCPASLGLNVAAVRIAGPTGGSQVTQVTISPESGSGPYTFQWSNGLRTRTAEFAAPGTYQVRVTDVYGCADQAEVKVGVSTSAGEVPPRVDRLSVFPNPSRSKVTVRFWLGKPEPAVLRVFSPLGSLVRLLEAEPSLGHDHQLSLDGVPPGVYWLSVQVRERQWGLPLVIIP